MAMFTLLAVLALGQGTAKPAQTAAPKPKPGPARPRPAEPAASPVIPAGARKEFHRAVYDVLDRLAKSDFVGAKASLRHLPKRSVRIQWDDRKVPADLREEFRRARNRALEQWRLADATLKFELVTKGADLRFAFEPRLAKDQTLGYAPGATWFFSESPSEPRLEVVIGLTRGPQSTPTRNPDVNNETLHGVGAYFGLDTSPLFGGAMGRTDLSAGRAMELRTFEGGIAKELFAVGDRLRLLANTKQVVRRARPQLFADPISFEVSVRQGDQIPLPIQLTNLGNGPLRWRLIPDCGCFTLPSPVELSGGTTKLLNASADTTEFMGSVTKNLLLITNDPEVPSRVIPIRMNIQPFFRFHSPAGNVMMVPEGGLFGEIFLAISDLKDFEIRELDLQGVEGIVEALPWKGQLPDPETGEPKPAEGFRIAFRIDGGLVPGRTFATILAQTNHLRFPELRYTFSLQQGIVALPESLFLGEIGQSARQYSFLVSRPGQPFKILSVESDAAYLKPTVSLVRPGEYRVSLAYSGRAPSGDLRGQITVKTDDPKQPTITVRFRGTRP